MIKPDRDPLHIHPVLRRKVECILAECEERGLSFGLFEGFRSWERQAELYAQGRTKPGDRVTNARPGESYHQYGCAVDLVLQRNKKWTWEGKRSDWEEMQRIAVAHGLEVLAWEMPHVQMRFSLEELQNGNLPPGADEEFAAFIRRAAWKK